MVDINIIIIFGFINYRLCKMFKDEDGILGIFIKLRMLVGIKYFYENELVANVEEYRAISDTENIIEIYENELARLFSCLWCLSIWIGFGIALLFSLNAFIITFATSTVAIFLDEILGRLRCDQQQ